MELPPEQWDEGLRLLIRNLLLARADVDAVIITMVRAKRAPFEELRMERQAARDRIQPLLDAIDSQNLGDFLQAFRRTFRGQPPEGRADAQRSRQ